MQKRHKKKPDQRLFFRTNERIFARELRVLDNEGKQIAVLSKEEALKLAREQGLDLIEIAPKATPPVARIADYNKYLYQQEKKKREEKRKSKVSETKEVRLGPFMDDHDLATMTRRAREFLEDGNKVRFVVKFHGRQIMHPEFGHKVLNKVLGDLSGISKVERDPHFEGKQLIVIITAEKKKSVHQVQDKSHEKKENKEIGIEKV